MKQRTNKFAYIHYWHDSVDLFQILRSIGSTKSHQQKPTDRPTVGHLNPNRLVLHAATNTAPVAWIWRSKWEMTDFTVLFFCFSSLFHFILLQPTRFGCLMARQNGWCGMKSFFCSLTANYDCVMQKFHLLSLSLPLENLRMHYFEYSLFFCTRKLFELPVAA